jgi:transposase
MAYNFHPCDRSQMMLMPPSLEEWLEEDHLARFVVDAVMAMNLEVLYKKYRQDGMGNTAYEPAMMLGVLLYGYCMGIRSSRKLEQLLEQDVAFRYLAANQHPDHATLARFRQENEKELEELFVEVLRLCAKAGLVKVGVVALDGTKIKANAAMEANRTAEGLDGQVRKMLKEAAELDESEDKKYGKDCRGDELPEGLRRSEERKKRLRECLERLEEEAQEAREAQATKIAQREKEEAQSGEKKRGRKPLSPDEAVDKETKANMTDPESRIMKTRRGYVQGYNSQAVVTKEQIIVAAQVTQEENDVNQLKPMMEEMKKTLKAVGVKERVETKLADAGYGMSEEVLEWAMEQKTLFLIATQKDWKQRKAAQLKSFPRGSIPRGLGAKEQMERRLLTSQGRRLYKMRSWMVEPVFGQVKEGQGFQKFSRRGKKAAQSEWKLQAASHNLLKLWRSGRSWN